jgi:hypothetical protein
MDRKGSGYIWINNNQFMPDCTTSNLSRNIMSKYKQLIRTTKIAATTTAAAATATTAEDR